MTQVSNLGARMKDYQGGGDYQGRGGDQDMRLGRKMDQACKLCWPHSSLDTQGVNLR